MSRPTAPSDAKPRLYVMKLSHFCERARWGLDHKRIAYDELTWAPGPHVLEARRMKANGSGVPILVAGDRVVQGSGAILSWADLREGDASIEHRFETVIGPLLRRYFYSGVLHDAGSGIREALMHDAPSVQASFARIGWPLIKRGMIKLMDIQPDLLPVLEEQINQHLDWSDTLVTDGVSLNRGKFGRTEITVASLLAPVAMPDAMPIYRTITLPPEISRAYERWNERPILQWVRHAYHQHRH